MKRIALIIAAAVLTLGACKPEIKPIGPAYEAGAGIIGTWELTGADQTDLTLPVPETRDISSFYTNAASTWVLTFNEDSTYAVTSQGPGFNVLVHQVRGAMIRQNSLLRCTLWKTRCLRCFLWEICLEVSIRM